MNEKIEKLALKCEFDIGQIMAEILCPQDEDLDILHKEWNKLPKETRHSIVSFLEERQEKFAELIVRECMDVVIKSHNGKINPKFVVEPLKEHFGIKE